MTNNVQMSFLDKRRLFVKLSAAIPVEPNDNPMMYTPKELKVIDAAYGLFRRHGFKRVTMHDIASALDMSRPALYLIFPNKEMICEAAIRHNGSQTLKQIGGMVSAQKTPQKQLRAAFELWAMRPFEAVQQNPESRDLIECTHGFAMNAMTEITQGFEAILRDILGPIAPKRGALDATALAQLLIAAVRGFKVTATTMDELETLIERQIAIILAALDRNGK
jgi:AcrR family transcriptional regulator